MSAISCRGSGRPRTARGEGCVPDEAFTLVPMLAVCVCGTPRTACSDDQASDPATRAKIGTVSVWFVGWRDPISVWRDFMPGVPDPENPRGPDGGSGLYVKAGVWLENGGTVKAQLSYHAEIVGHKGEPLLDENGKPLTMTFEVEPNFRVLPLEIDSGWADLNDNERSASIRKYNVIWDGSLNPGEKRYLQVSSHNGPYLKPGESVRVKITFTDDKGSSASVLSLFRGIEKKY